MVGPWGLEPQTRENQMCAGTVANHVRCAAESKSTRPSQPITMPYSRLIDKSVASLRAERFLIQA
jgi:hypothetical protein